jgi:hypothetical protein
MGKRKNKGKSHLHLRPYKLCCCFISFSAFAIFRGAAPGPLFPCLCAPRLLDWFLNAGATRPIDFCPLRVCVVNLVGVVWPQYKQKEKKQKQTKPKTQNTTKARARLLLVLCNLWASRYVKRMSVHPSIRSFVCVCTALSLCMQQTRETKKRLSTHSPRPHLI